MTCQVDIKAYALGEATPAERRTAETHIASCAVCRSEFESLNMLRTVLMTDPDQEPPRRIAFVSDKIFEPKWWQRALGIGAGWNPMQLLAPVALSALASFAIVKVQSVGMPVGSIASAGPNSNQLVQQSSAPRGETDRDKDVAARVDAAVKQAVAEVRAQDQAQTSQLLQASERRMRAEHEQSMAETMAAVDYRFELMRKREVKLLRASAETGAN